MLGEPFVARWITRLAPPEPASGGRIIGKNLNRTYHLHGAGLAFYDFPAIAKPKLYKDAYRHRLDALELSDADTARIVDEVKVAFGLNQAIFAGLVDYDEAGRVIPDLAERWEVLDGGRRYRFFLRHKIATQGEHFENNVERLVEDHENAKFLAEGLGNVPGIELLRTPVETNIVIFSVANTGMTAAEFARIMHEDHGVRMSPYVDPTTVRAVTHMDVTREDCAKGIAAVNAVATNGQLRVA